MTPLQIAAQAVIARWESPKWKDEAPTAVVIGALLKALTDEQAQAVEPVAWMSTDCIGERTLLFTKPAWEPIPDKVDPLYLHPAPPPADERAKVGNSNFESWYAETKIQQMGTKQRYREAYEAGLNEAQQVAVPKVTVELPDGDERTVKTWFTEMRNGELVVSISVEAQQVAAPVPMTDSQISDAWESIHPSKEYPVTRLGRHFARAIEKHHGIGAKP